MEILVNLAHAQTNFPAAPTGGKFAVAGQQIAGASENFVLNY